MKWQNCRPENYTGTYPMLEISDGEQTYCAPASGRTEDEMVEEFVESFRFSDDCEDTEEAREELAEDLVVVYHLSPPAASEDEMAEINRWIAASIGQNRIVRADASRPQIEALKEMSADWVEAAEYEFWGTDDDGDNWRVHAAR